MEIKEKSWNLCGKEHVGYEASIGLSDGCAFKYEKLYDFADSHSDCLRKVFEFDTKEAFKRKKMKFNE